ncbi:hypothetical protein KR054_009024, partial [Drosophila jambulina]
SSMQPKSNDLPKGRFVLRTLLFWLFFLLVAIPQWMVMCLYAKEPFPYTLTLLICGFILLAFIHVFEEMRYSRPWNFMCIFICYELLTIGVALFLSKWDLVYTLSLIAVGVAFAGLVMLISLFLILTGAYPEAHKILLVGCMGFILVFCIRSLDIFNRWFFLRDIELTIFLTSVVIVMVCLIVITNENFDLLRQDDPMNVAFSLHVCYMLILVAGRVAAFCIEANVRYFEYKKTTTKGAPKFVKFF